MKIIDIVQLIEGKLLTFPNQNINEKEYLKAFACDLMSDCLAYVNVDNCLLITGLANQQALRTAEMLDIDCIIFARGKKLSKEMLELAKENNMTLIATQYTLFEVSGLLYQAGILALKI
ncbi:transcriptional regulator [Mycoplasmatota bacterium]|nr:transcriptional regulator [Mycoplasmatota bacterium]